jgi:phage integrase
LAAEWGELLALTSEDIDFESGMVNIFKTYYRRNQTDYITSPKTESSNRKITIPKFLQEKLKNFLDRQYGLALEKRIFPITDRAIQKKMKLAKLKLIRVHDLRHSHIALLIEKGMQPLVIAQRVGHDSVNTTMNIYGHLYPNKQKQVADLLNAEATGEPESNLVDMATEMRFRKAGG